MINEKKHYNYVRKKLEFIVTANLLLHWIQIKKKNKVFIENIGLV